MGEDNLLLIGSRPSLFSHVDRETLRVVVEFIDGPAFSLSSQSEVSVSGDFSSFPCTTWTLVVFRDTMFNADLLLLQVT